MSTLTTSKHVSGVGKEESGVTECFCTLARWHCMHDCVQCLISELIPGQMKR